MKYILGFFLSISSLCFPIDHLPHCISDQAISYSKQYLPENPVVLECGAFDGYETSIMAMTWPNGIIHSFEPVPSIFNKLNENTYKFHNVRIYQLALGDFCGKSIFHLSTINGEQFGAGSVLPPSDYLLGYSNIKFEESIEVNVVTLDKWAKMHGIKRIDFMWLDMQGYELNMLKKSKLAKKAKVIYIEVEFQLLYENQYLYQDVLKWMEKNGFEMVANDFSEQNKNFGNAVFVNRK